MSWNFHNAFPAKWTGPTFDASQSAIAFESIELVHEGISRPWLI
jgi:phage tail-like protein